MGEPTATFVQHDEKHYSATELASLWGLHPDSIRNLFRGEQGVILLGTQRSTRRRRCYTTMRIPASVAERVHRKLQNR